MVNTEDNLKKIKAMVDSNKYFVLNRPRQVGKSTTLALLQKILQPRYAYIYTGLEGFSEHVFKTEEDLVEGLAFKFDTEFEFVDTGLSSEAKEAFAQKLKESASKPRLSDFVDAIRDMCKASSVRVVLAIDEIDAGRAQPCFLKFLSLLGDECNKRRESAFQSVILVGLADITHLQSGDEEGDESISKYKMNWNKAFASASHLDMSFSREAIAGMLDEYRTDRALSFDVGLISGLLAEYTSGYPYFVSKLCEIMDSKVSGADLASAWTQEGFTEALRILSFARGIYIFYALSDLIEIAEIRETFKSLMRQEPVRHLAGSKMEWAITHGFARVDSDGFLKISNRIFEAWLGRRLR
jgi:energy-coupling factor transporter ATP-binding protein EcfA2